MLTLSRLGVLINGKGGGSSGQGSRKLEPLEPPVPDKPHLVGQNEIYMKNDWTYYGKSKEILSYSDKLDIWIFKK